MTPYRALMIVCTALVAAGSLTTFSKTVYSDPKEVQQGDSVMVLEKTETGYAWKGPYTVRGRPQYTDVELADERVVSFSDIIPTDVWLARQEASNKENSR